MCYVSEHEDHHILEQHVCMRAHVIKYFGLAVGPYARQHEPKWPKNYFTFDVTHKKSAPLNQKIFFECLLEDLPNLLRV